MPFAVLMLPFFAAAAQSGVVRTDPIVVTGRAGIPFISPMGEPIRARSPGENTLARWFARADSNHDGALTPGEMVADAERFFEIIDTDHNGQIDPDELIHYEWQVAPEIQVNARDRRLKPRPAGDEDATDDKRKRRDPSAMFDDGPQGAARYALLNMPEPVAAADADLNRAISLDEFRQAARERFTLLDRTHAGTLTLAGLEAMLPPAPQAGRRYKKRKDEADTRIGVPLPPG